MEAVKSAVRKHDYSKAVDAVHMVENILDSKVCEYEDKISILDAIKTEAVIQSQTLIAELSNRWKEINQWTLPSEKEKDRGEPHTTVLRINTEVENTDILENVVIGMRKMGILDYHFKEFGQTLYNNIIKPVIQYGKCEVVSSDENQIKTLSVKITPPGASELVSYTNPEDMFANLYMVLQFLHRHLLHVVIDDGIREKNASTTLMNLLGSFISDDTLNLAVKQCLIKAIPSSNKELEQFNTVIVQTEEVQKLLLKIGFIQADNSVLIDYVQNVNTLFANKKCQEIFERARKLMTVEVHNTVRVSDEKPLGELPPLIDGEGGSSSKKARKVELAAETTLSPNTFKLPTCLIR